MATTTTYKITTVSEYRRQLCVRDPDSSLRVKPHDGILCDYVDGKNSAVCSIHQTMCFSSSSCVVQVVAINYSTNFVSADGFVF